MHPSRAALPPRAAQRLAAVLTVLTTALTLVYAPPAAANTRPDDRTRRHHGVASPGLWPVGEDSGGHAVSWRAPQHRQSSYRNARRWWGAATTRIRIRGPHAPHVYAFHLRLPAHTRLRVNRYGEVIARRHHHRIGMLGRPWAKNARGHPVRTWYTVRGHTVKQHVRFSRHSRFPLRADPWWNPFTWRWDSAFHLVWDEVRSCGRGATREVLALAGATVALNLMLIHVAGRVALALPGGGYAYAGTAVYGCIGSYF